MSFGDDTLNPDVVDEERRKSLARIVIMMAELGDDRAMCIDDGGAGIPATWEELSDQELETFFQSAFDLAKLTVGEEPPERPRALAST